MNTNTNKKVVCVKDIPSNIIEEAIFILKTDGTEIKDKKRSLIREEIILKETEELVREYEDEFNDIEIEYEDTKSNKLSDFKIKMFLIGVLFVSICYLISILIKI